MLSTLEPLSGDAELAVRDGDRTVRTTSASAEAATGLTELVDLAGKAGFVCEGSERVLRGGEGRCLRGAGAYEESESMDG